MREVEAEGQLVGHCLLLLVPRLVLLGQEVAGKLRGCHRAGRKLRKLFLEGFWVGALGREGAGAGRGIPLGQGQAAGGQAAHALMQAAAAGRPARMLQQRG